MACRLGITTDPIRSRQEWERRHPTLHNWKILEQYPSKDRAQTDVVALARIQGCEYDRIVDGPDIASWFVFRFDH